MDQSGIGIGAVAIVLTASMTAWLVSRIVTSRSPLPDGCRAALGQRLTYFLGLGLSGCLLGIAGAMWLARYVISSANEEDVLAATLALAVWCVPVLIAAGFVLRRAWQRWRLLLVGQLVRARPLRSLQNRTASGGRVARVVYEFDACDGQVYIGRSPRIAWAAAEAMERLGWLEVVYDRGYPRTNEINLHGLV